MKQLILSMAITAGLAGSAIAADLPVKSPRIAAAPVVMTNWTGCYVGAGFGYGMWNQEHYRANPATLVATTPSATAGGRGWLGTVQVGCDYQFADRWVVGAFGDYDWASIKGNFNPVGTTLVGEEKLKSQWAVGGRLGYVVVPKLLTYVAGGYTEARFGQVDFPVAGGPIVTTVSLAAQTYKGWFIASGYEYAVDFLPGLFWKSEYRYSSFRAADVPLSISVLGVTAVTDAIHSQKYVQTVRSELVYRFNWGAGPVVARY
jgi:outer membrane immunogenic protein